MGENVWDTSKFPIKVWNNQVPRNVGAQVLEPQEYKPHKGKWEEDVNGDRWSSSVNNTNWDTYEQR